MTNYISLVENHWKWYTIHICEITPQRFWSDRKSVLFVEHMLLHTLLLDVLHQAPKLVVRLHRESIWNLSTRGTFWVFSQKFDPNWNTFGGLPESLEDLGRVIGGNMKIWIGSSKSFQLQIICLLSTSYGFRKHRSHYVIRCFLKRK